MPERTYTFVRKRGTEGLVDMLRLSSGYAFTYARIYVNKMFCGSMHVRNADADALVDLLLPPSEREPLVLEEDAADAADAADVT